MNRIIPGPVRALLRYVAANEVIACGLMDDSDSHPIVIFSPQMQRNHRLGVRQKRRFHERRMEAPEPFIGDMVIQTKAVDAEKGDVYRVWAQHRSRSKQVHSPDIVMKMQTDRRNDLLECRTTKNSMIWYWGDIPGEYRGMIYFLGIEDIDGTPMFGAYTGEKHFTYPRCHEGVLFLNGREVELNKGKQYRASLHLVDYDGWVPLVSENISSW